MPQQAQRVPVWRLGEGVEGLDGHLATPMGGGSASRDPSYVVSTDVSHDQSCEWTWLALVCDRAKGAKWRSLC